MIRSFKPQTVHEGREGDAAQGSQARQALDPLNLKRFHGADEAYQLGVLVRRERLGLSLGLELYQPVAQRGWKATVDLDQEVGFICG
jgi:hypothetical protein